jgi:hypothetical protein
MASIVMFPKGMGESLGDSLVTSDAELWLIVDVVQFVHHSGSDANGGSTRQLPKATLAGAVAVDNNAFIVLLDGHAESIATDVLIAARTTVVGAGATAGVPNCTLTLNSAVNSVINLEGGELRTLKFASPTLASAGYVLKCQNVNYGRIVGCRFEGGATVDLGLILLNSAIDGTEMRDCTIVSVATAAALAGLPLKGVNADGHDQARFVGCVFDDGAYGFQSGSTLLIDAATPWMESCGLLRGAKAIAQGATKAVFGIPTATGNGAVQWTVGSYTYADGLSVAPGTPFSYEAPLNTTSGLFAWYVHYGTGTDAVAPAGLDKQRPLKTLHQAVTNANSGDIIVLLDGHDETLTATVADGGKTLHVIGCGWASGKPTVKLTLNNASSDLLQLTGACSQVRGVWFKGSTQTTTADQLLLNGISQRVQDCYFERSAKDVGKGVRFGASAVNSEIRDTAFVATNTTYTDQPRHAIYGTLKPDKLVLNNVTVDGGTYGFHGAEAVSVVIDRPKFENLSLLRGADMHVTGILHGYIQVTARTGGARVVLAVSGV